MSSKLDLPLRYLALAGVGVLFAIQAMIGINWGLPSRKIDKYLFGEGEVWPGEKIYRLAGAQGKFSPTRGADVDPDPLSKTRVPPSPQPSPLEGEGELPPLEGEGGIPLTATDEDVAKILLRYRLYTYQPDEMITMMALAGMRPGQLDLDPRLYQYGGLFIYPVGALIKLCGLLGLIDVRSDVVFYLDHPDEFGKFYIVARAYSAAWGLLGVMLVYAITKRLVSPSPSPPPQDGVGHPRTSDSIDNRQSTIDNPSVPSSLSPFVPQAIHRAALLAALLFALMPVVVCMSHEGKPHLPGAVLMLLGVYLAMRSLDASTAHAVATGGQAASGAQGGSHFWWMCVVCGAAVGMVLSSWPIFVLIPLTAWLQVSSLSYAASPLPARERPGRATASPLTKGGLRGVALHWPQIARRTVSGTAIALLVYLLTNPYIAINAVVNREVLKSNFGNSLAMYEISRVGEGFRRVIELTIEGATLPILILGLIALAGVLVRRQRSSLPLIVVAAVFFLQFVLIGAGKPAEYGRFGIFTNTALATGAAALLTVVPLPHLPRIRTTLMLVVLLWIGVRGFAYLDNFRTDATDYGSRLNARRLTRIGGVGSNLDIWTALPWKVGVPAEPAPYSCPPLPFPRVAVYLIRPERIPRMLADDTQAGWVLVRPVNSRLPDQARGVSPDSAPWSARARDLIDAIGRRLRQSPTSWANKPIEVATRGATVVQ